MAFGKKQDDVGVSLPPSDAATETLKLPSDDVVVDPQGVIKPKSEPAPEPVKLTTEQRLAKIERILRAQGNDV